MKLDPITPTELQRGDILLCKIPPLSLREYLSSILAVVSQYLKTGNFDLKAATPLIHWLIGYLDEGLYFHASFWNGSKVVESRIKGGLKANDIQSYDGDTVDIYRFQTSGQWLGSDSLPVEPLLKKAKELVDRHWTYGFDSAFLLAILCVSRWDRARWVDHLREFLVRHAPSDQTRKEIGEMIDRLRPQINGLIERLIVLALEAVRQYRQRPGYVCSQTVAVIYNEAGDATHPVGTYEIPKPNYALLKAAPVALVAAPQTKKEISACEQKIRELGAELAKLPTRSEKLLLTSASSDYESLKAGLLSDSLYTPRDLAESSSTKLVGRLDLAPEKVVA